MPPPPPHVKNNNRKTTEKQQRKGKWRKVFGFVIVLSSLTIFYFTNHDYVFVALRKVLSFMVSVKKIMLNSATSWQYSLTKVKVDLIKFSIPIYIFVHNRSFLDFLPNFNLLRTLQLAFFWTFISENLAPPLIFPCSYSSFRIGVNDVIFSKILHGLKL